MQNILAAGSGSEILLVMAILAVAIIVIWLVSRAVAASKEKKVKESSTYYKGVQALNEKYTFNTFEKLYDGKKIKLNSKAQFDSYKSSSEKYEKALKEYIDDHKSYFEGLVKKYDENVEMLKNYTKELEDIPLTQDADVAKKAGFTLLKYNEKEKNLAEKIIKNPNKDYTVRISISYRSPKGQNYYTHHKDYTLNKVGKLLNEMLAKEYYGESKTKTRTSKRTSGEKTSEETKTFKRVTSLDDLDEID